MDSTTFRLVLVAIAVVLAIAIFMIGQHQSRLRKRNAMETFTREEVDSAFIEDELLRSELDNLNRIMLDSEVDANVDNIQINPSLDVSQFPYTVPSPEIFVPPELAKIDDERLISHHLRHDDYRLITGEELQVAVQHAGLTVTSDGCLQCRQDGEVVFEIASLSTPGHFSGMAQLDFTTLGLNCYVDTENSENPPLAYEIMLKKVDELVRMLNVKVYLTNQELLTIKDVTRIRDQLVRDLSFS